MPQYYKFLDRLEQVSGDHSLIESVRHGYAILEASHGINELYQLDRDYPGWSDGWDIAPGSINSSPGRRSVGVVLTHGYCKVGLSVVKESSGIKYSIYSMSSDDGLLSSDRVDSMLKEIKSEFGYSTSYSYISYIDAVHIPVILKKLAEWADEEAKDPRQYTFNRMTDLINESYYSNDTPMLVWLLSNLLEKHPINHIMQFKNQITKGYGPSTAEILQKCIRYMFDEDELNKVTAKDIARKMVEFLDALEHLCNLETEVACIPLLRMVHNPNEVNSVINNILTKIELDPVSYADSDCRLIANYARTLI